MDLNTITRQKNIRRYFHIFLFALFFVLLGLSLVRIFTGVNFFWFNNIDIVLTIFILGDAFLLQAVTSERGIKHEKFWISFFVTSLLFCLLWNISKLYYAGLYNFHTVAYVIAIIIGLVTLKDTPWIIRADKKLKRAVSVPGLEYDFADDREKESANKERKSKAFEQQNSRFKKIPMLNVLARLFYTEGKYFIGGLSIIVIMGFFIRLFCALWGNINLDEGIHLYDAKLLTEGFLPFRDYFAREPYYLYSLAFFMKIFGFNLITSRLYSVIANTLCIIVIYIIGRRLISKKVGLVAAALYSLSPFVFYNDFLGNLYGVYPLITSLFILSFLSLLKKPTLGILIISGLLFGAATHFYRLTIFYYPIVGFIWGLQNHKSRFKHLLLFYLPFSLTYLLPLVYFSIIAGYKNFEIIYGANELILAYFFVLIFYLIGKAFSYFVEVIKEKKDLLCALIIVILLALVLYSFMNMGMDIENKTRVMFVGFLQNYFLLFPLVAAFIIFIKKLLSNQANLFTIIKIILLVTILLIGWYGSTIAPGLELWGARPVSRDFTLIFMIFFIASIAFLFFFDRIVDAKQVFSRIRPAYVWLLFFAPTIFYAIHVQMSATNYKSFIILGSIFSAVGILIIYKIYIYARLYLKIFLLALVIFLFYSPIYLYTQTKDRGRLWPQESRQVVNKYLVENTSVGEEVFTNALVFVVETNRRSANDVSRGTIYGDLAVDTPDYFGTSAELIPSREYAEYVEKNVNLILMDNRTKAIFKTNKDFSEILENYYLDTSWPEYQINAWKKIGT